MADAVSRRMAHHASAAVGRRDLLVRLVEEEEAEAARLAVPLLLFVTAEKELGAEPGRPPCRERRAADTMMVGTVVESDNPWLMDDTVVFYAMTDGSHLLCPHAWLAKKSCLKMDVPCFFPQPRASRPCHHHFAASPEMGKVSSPDTREGEERFLFHCHRPIPTGRLCKRDAGGGGSCGKFFCVGAAPKNFVQRPEPFLRGE